MTFEDNTTLNENIDPSGHLEITGPTYKRQASAIQSFSVTNPKHRLCPIVLDKISGTIWSRQFFCIVSNGEAGILIAHGNSENTTGHDDKS